MLGRTTRVLAVAAAISVALAPLASRGAADTRTRQPRAAAAMLVSANGRYTAGVLSTGALVVQERGRVIFSTGTKAKNAHLRVQADGNLVLRAGNRLLWSSGTQGSGRHNQLKLANDGALELLGAAGPVWTSTSGNHCGDNADAHLVTISLATQHAWMCTGRTQLLSVAVTTGAADLGSATPTGTWHVQGKQTDRYLYPASGGRYFVHYWIPYDGDYGMHDSPWQGFAYGSPQYRTLGSHGCVHLPPAAMAWLFNWAPIGTTVSVQ